MAWIFFRIHKERKYSTTLDKLFKFIALEFHYFYIKFIEIIIEWPNIIKQSKTIFNIEKWNRNIF